MDTERERGGGGRESSGAVIFHNPGERLGERQFLYMVVMCCFQLHAWPRRSYHLQIDIFREILLS